MIQYKLLTESEEIPDWVDSPDLISLARITSDLKLGLLSTNYSLIYISFSPTSGKPFLGFIKVKFCVVFRVSFLNVKWGATYTFITTCLFEGIKVCKKMAAYAVVKLVIKPGHDEAHDLIQKIRIILYLRRMLRI